MDLRIKITKNKSNTESYNFKTLITKEIHPKYTKNVEIDFTFPSTVNGFCEVIASSNNLTRFCLPSL